VVRSSKEALGEPTIIEGSRISRSHVVSGRARASTELGRWEEPNRRHESQIVASSFTFRLIDWMAQGEKSVTETRWEPYAANGASPCSFAIWKPRRAGSIASTSGRVHGSETRKESVGPPPQG